MDKVIRLLVIITALAVSLSAQYTAPVSNLPTGGNGAGITLISGTSWSGVSGCVPYRSTTDFIISCDSELVKTTGILTLTNGTSPILSLKNSGSNQNAFVEWQNTSGRQWLLGPGLPGGSNTGLAYAEYTNGVFQQITFYIKKGGTTCIGKSNSECTSSTASFKDATASTGATRVLVQLGAADSATTATVTNSGTTKSAGYQSSDGTAGVTGTTCVAATMSVKNGLVVAGCT